MQRLITRFRLFFLLLFLLIVIFFVFEKIFNPYWTISGILLILTVGTALITYRLWLHIPHSISRRYSRKDKL